MKQTSHPNPKPPRGRPARPLPEPIDAIPEDVARALLITPPKAETDWRFIKKPKPA